uniref:CYRIA/CYRIB Rac1 binding domain-containing protein n=1 Tax=Panagrolaimus sp. JU765 TaxID=591449 RepID=A0AC34QEW5_9BILA
MKTLISVTADFVDCSQLGVANITDTLVAFVYISRHMLDRKSNSDRISAETQEFFARVMVGAFILFDHTDENGGFCRNSPIDVRGIVELVKRHEKISGELLIQNKNCGPKNDCFWQLKSELRTIKIQKSSPIRFAFLEENTFNFDLIHVLKKNKLGHCIELYN